MFLINTLGSTKCHPRWGEKLIDCCHRNANCCHRSLDLSLLKKILFFLHFPSRFPTRANFRGFLHQMNLFNPQTPAEKREHVHYLEYVCQWDKGTQCQTISQIQRLGT
ncbi:hypothetical protein TNCT_382001 [Trichonephila clavata]|uniref:Uncharacterized protein n=1 Tax=Trichonephila clavata TaxID=2740835 RepID=A0A8X6FUF0_TRICU|nr:hypothetical protein TNCT_382001 [Trichonephila clavata]